MNTDDQAKLAAAQLEQMVQLLESIRIALVTGVPRDAVPELRDDLRSLTSAVQILSGRLKRRSEEQVASASA